MKDYYYFLGIDNEATDDEIRKAYRKLSLKYHPDKNGNDPFFIKRFQEIQEAYDTLNNSKTRQIYNHNLAKEQKQKPSTLPPYIKIFSANKTFAKEGDEVIIKWQTNNADFIKILPFGLEKPYGEKIFKITQFNEGKFHIILHATNSAIKKTTVQGITIQKMSEYNNISTPNNISKKRPYSVHNIHKKRKSFLIILLIIILATLYLIYN